MSTSHNPPQPQIKKEEEALEDRSIEYHPPTIKQEPIQGEDLSNYIKDDYHKIKKLDTYNYKTLDDKEYSEMSISDKRRADEEIQKRHKKEYYSQKKIKNQRNLPKILNQDSLYSESRNDLSLELKKRKENYYEGMEDIYNIDKEDDPDEEKYLQLDTIRGKLSQWIKDSKTVLYIKKKFRTFLLKFRDRNNELVYEKRLTDMCVNNKQSIEITYKHLSDKNPTLAYWIFETPALILPYLNNVVFDLACNFYPGYQDIQDEVYIKIKDFPLEEKIRDLRTFHINTLVKVKGVVTRRYPIYQKLKKLFYLCIKCGDRKGPLYQNDKVDISLGQCATCQSNGPYKVDNTSKVYGNHQKITVQESPGTVLPGRVPRSKEVILLGDNIDIARPGDEIEIIGIYSSRFDYNMNVKHGAPIFSTFIEGNSIKRTHEIESHSITEDDKEKIKKLAKNPKVFEIITQSIAPSIFGHSDIKKSIALALFSGVAKTKDSHRIRGDINILLLGDPGLGKSQFLKYIQHVSHRSIYTTGKGASAVGLTASVKRDPISGEWCLEGGALVLADTGICLIDEFDKMNENDRTSIHEAMEQQSISISKAGIVANLQARCSVIAAANPYKGNYDDKMSFKENVELSDPILSRFDVLCVLKDEVNICNDKRLADFIVRSHIINHPDVERVEENDFKNILDQNFLKKYILYSKKNFKPRMTMICGKILENFYIKLREQSKKSSGLNIVVRHLESLIRLSTASAKLHLRNEVTEKDCHISIGILLNSFIKSQKPSIAQNLKKKFTSFLKRVESNNSKLAYILNTLMNQQILYKRIKMKRSLEEKSEVKIPMSEFVSMAKENVICKFDGFLRSDYFKENFELEVVSGIEFIKKIV